MDDELDELFAAMDADEDDTAHPQVHQAQPRLQSDSGQPKATRPPSRDAPRVESEHRVQPRPVRRATIADVRRAAAYPAPSQHASSPSGGGSGTAAVVTELAAVRRRAASRARSTSAVSPGGPLARQPSSDGGATQSLTPSSSKRQYSDYLEDGAAAAEQPLLQAEVSQHEMEQMLVDSFAGVSDAVAARVCPLRREVLADLFKASRGGSVGQIFDVHFTREYATAPPRCLECGGRILDHRPEQGDDVVPRPAPALVANARAGRSVVAAGQIRMPANLDVDGDDSNAVDVASVLPLRRYAFGFVFAILAGAGLCAGLSVSGLMAQYPYAVVALLPILAFGVVCLFRAEHFVVRIQRQREGTAEFDALDDGPTVSVERRRLLLYCCPDAFSVAAKEFHDIELERPDVRGLGAGRPCVYGRVRGVPYLVPLERSPTVAHAKAELSNWRSYFAWVTQDPRLAEGHTS